MTIPAFAGGLCAVRITEWHENFKHQHPNVRVENRTQYGDPLQFVDFNHVANVPVLSAATVADFALAPGQPQKVIALGPPYDTTGTTLRWEKPAGMPANASFEVVYRDTDEPDWASVIPVGTVTTIQLPISKDNVIFGVRSVDQAGHRSAAVYPVVPPRAPPPVGAP